MADAEELTQRAQLLALLGNSLLTTMNRTGGPGLDPALWAALPDFGSDAVDEALNELFVFATEAQGRIDGGEDVATEVSYEITKLFVGPPAPVAAPWETYYPEIPEGMEVPEPTCGFGQPTFDMRELLREAGLGLAGQNHQFEDHIGIELLYLSTLYSRAAQGDTDAAEKAAAFIPAHPARWIGRLMAKVEEAFPEGYVLKLLRLAQALLAL